jgi:hypothetical protein
MVFLQTVRSAQAAQCSAIDTSWRTALAGVLARFKQKASWPARVNNEETGCESTKCIFLTLKSENH